ncbi:dihydropteroate synthase [Sphingomonas nostoxanthinifaciens]|uniref:dihydropteroate synthase n=1 Tax=Sphingomonas nostoxanthinifaciens TaxID=2872652 RepID=UPI001CC1D42A|nr:dihydropteroate synthase [Sphingomonas nostoxanthinifaciens]UAK24953.1 dihydropteroate synthase [Sphingomonas nostoxanthinifaciens]
MTRAFLRPTAFVDAPFGHDGQVLRLAGGLVWFSAVELIVVADGRRIRQELVPVERLDAALATLGAAEAAARATLACLTAPRAPLVLGARTVPLDQPQAMAILNVTPDSFSDGGAHAGDPAGAAEAGMRMLEAGAAMLDIGGESTRPGAATVWEGDEIARVAPVIERLARAGAAISIDTRKAAVMAAALDAGAGLVNDVSALTYDPQALGLVAARRCPVVLMHYQGAPATMQRDPHYRDVLIEVYDWLAERIAACEAAGIARANILVDPGIGFGKTLRHNLALLNGLSLFHGLGCPIVLGASRKRTIGALSNEAPVEQRLSGSIALALAGAAQGVQLLRVHDAFETVQALRVWRGLRDEALAPA